MAAATADAFSRPELLLLVLGLTVASAAFHEIGHAAACRYGGGKPGGMGAGIYLVWPAFYTDVTDAYRLPRRSRLRTDLGGIYFNAFVAVLTLGIWLATGIEALLLLIAVQMLEIVKNLSPVIRADGYHILSDATGVPDLYAHMGPTLKRLLPWKRHEPSALKGWARVFVTGWVLIIVPILLGMAFSAILLFPKLAASAWESGSGLISQMGDQDALGVATGIFRLVALALPVMGVTLIMQRLVTSTGKKAWGWSDGRPPRQALVLTGTAALVALLAWTWWPSGQYQPVRPTDDGTLVGAFRTASAPVATARPAGVLAPAPLAPGRHLAVALIPRGGADRGASGALRRQRRRQGRQADDPRQPGGARRPQGAGPRRPRRQPGGGARRARAGGRGARGRLVRRAVDDRAGHPAPVHAAGRAGRGRLAGARDQHHRRRDRLRRRLLAGHGQGRRPPSRTRTPPTRWPAARPARRWRSPSSSCSSSARATRSCRSTSPRRST